MAFAYDLLAEYGYLPPGEAFPKVKEAARRALEIDATTAEAYTALAVAASYYDCDWVRADEGFRHALELNPNSAVTHDWYGVVFLNAMGRHEEAIAHNKRARSSTRSLRTSGRIWDGRTTTPAGTMRQSPNASRSRISTRSSTSPTGVSASPTGRRACSRKPLPPTNVRPSLNQGI